MMLRRQMGRIYFYVTTQEKISEEEERRGEGKGQTGEETQATIFPCRRVGKRLPRNAGVEAIGYSTNPPLPSVPQPPLPLSLLIYTGGGGGGLRYVTVPTCISI